MARKEREKSVEFKSVKLGKNKSWVCLGVDISVSVVAVAAFGWDDTLKKLSGPAFAKRRWNEGQHWLTRLGDAANGPKFVLEAMSGLAVLGCALDRVFIAVEEPWYPGAVKTGQSAYLMQQAQIHGAFVGSLARYGYQNIYDVNNQTWKKYLRNEGFAMVDKFSVKKWARKAYVGVPAFPDLIGGKHGKQDKPITSKAKPLQPADEFDALAVMDWMRAKAEEEHDLPS